LPKKPRGSAKDRALLLLSVRWRSRQEIRRRLRSAGFEAEEVEQALMDLEGVGLIEDDRFAREMVRDQAGRRLAGNRSIRANLLQKGVAPEVVDQALEEAGEEAQRACELARQRALRLTGLAPEAAYRRLYGLLLRRGYGPGVARDACRAALDEIMGAAAGPDD
jgi:regulatory protein